MNVLYVGDCGPVRGGAAIASDQLVRGLARHGWRLRVLAPELDGGDPELVALDAARPELEMHHYPVPSYFIDPSEAPPRPWEEATRAGVQRELERLIVQSRPDVLLLRELWLPYANPVRIRHGLPAIVMVRGNPTGAVLAGTFPRERTARFLDALRTADQIVTVAQHFVPELRRLGLETVTCVQNAVDPRRFAPAERDRALAARLGIAASDVVALHVSQMKPIKRPLDIVRSAPAVLRRRPEVLYLFVGEGVCLEEMKALARRSGVIARCRFEGFVDNHVMPEYMNLADLVVMPSEREGLSRVYLEAQACARTLVASDIPAAREVVSDGRTGLLFRKGDADDLAEKISMATGDPVLRAEIGRRARRHVEEHHHIDTAIERYRTLTEELLTRMST